MEKPQAITIFVSVHCELKDGKYEVVGIEEKVRQYNMQRQLDRKDYPSLIEILKAILKK